MPTTEIHCKNSFALFGKAYKEVHIWLDEFAGTLDYGMRHRRVRHHLDGVELVKIKFGDEAATVALQHIIDDFKEEGWVETDPIPKNEQDYLKMGLF